MNRRSEFSGKPSTSRIDVNPMVGRIAGCQLTPSDRLGLLYRTGFEDTSRPLNRRAWLGWELQPIPPRRNRIPPE